MDRQPVRERVDAFAEPAAFALRTGGDVDQAGVLCVEDAGDLGERFLVLELLLPGSHVGHRTYVRYGNATPAYANHRSPNAGLSNSRMEVPPAFRSARAVAP